MLKDKLLPDFCHGFFWSEENVDLNYFPTHHDGFGCWYALEFYLGRWQYWMILWQMLSQYYQIIVLTDVIAKNCGRSYCQTCRQMLLPFLCEMVTPHFMADVRPILLKYCLGWCFYQDPWQILLPILWADVIALVCELLIPHCKILISLLSKAADVIAITFCGRWITTWSVADYVGWCYCHGGRC